MTGSDVERATSRSPSRRIHVVATTAEKARRALAVAMPLISDIVGLSTIAVDQPIDDDVGAARLAGCVDQPLAAGQDGLYSPDADVDIEMHPFSTLDELLAVIPAGEYVVISGPSGAWTLSPEEELANQLSECGRRAVFVACLRVEECGRPPSMPRDERTDA